MTTLRQNNIARQSTHKGAVVYTHSFFRDDVGFLAALRAGHRGARGVLFQRYAPAVEQVVLSIVGPDQEDVSELVERVFSRALVQLPRFRGRHADSLEQWLLRITVRVVKSYLRSSSISELLAGRFRRRPPALDWDALEESSAAFELAPSYDVLAMLSSSQRVVFCLHDVAGWDTVEVASCCNLSRGRVRRLLTQSRAKLEQVVVGTEHSELHHDSSAEDSLLGRAPIDGHAARLARILTRGLPELSEEQSTYRDDNCERFLSKAEQREGKRSRRVLGVACATVGIVLTVGALAYWIHRPSELTYDVAGAATDPQWLAAEASSVTTSFSDGSRLELAPGGRLRLRLDEPPNPGLTLETGFVRVELAESESRKWWVNAGPFVILGSGASLDVFWDSGDQLFEVTVNHGSARVEGPVLGDSRLVASGQCLRVSVASARAVLTTGAEAASMDAMGESGELPSLEAWERSPDVIADAVDGPFEGSVPPIDTRTRAATAHVDSTQAD